MTKIEFIIETFRRLATQGQQSISAGGTCLYRGPNGLKCAAGMWIKSGTTPPEQTGVDNPDVYVCLEQEAQNNLETLRALQSFHDNPDNWTLSVVLSNAMRNFCLGVGQDCLNAYFEANLPILVVDNFVAKEPANAQA